MSKDNKEESEVFDESVSKIVDLGNEIMDEYDEDNLTAIASGMLAGAIQFWLYSRQPCDDNNCDGCKPISTADLRKEELIEEVMQFAISSEYYHSPNDRDVGKA
jgi:hypothetical protein